MASEIKAEEINIGKLFSPEFVFKIPIYQRPLSWDRDNYEQLFDDVYDAMDSNESSYFLGSILIQQQEEKKYDLVDGQQRMTALAILMAVIRDYTESDNLRGKLTTYLRQEEDKYKGDAEAVRIISWEELKDIFNTYVYMPEGIKRYEEDFENKAIKYADNQDPRYHLYEAIDTFKERILEYLSDTKELEKYVIYLLNNVYVVYIKTGETTSAFRLFNVLNTRGLPLRTSDLLKSENIGAIDDEEQRDKYARLWIEIEKNIGREELEDVIAFIRTILVKERAKLSIYDEYRKIIFTDGLMQMGAEFIDYLASITEIYESIVLDGDIQASADKKNEYKSVVGLLKTYIPFNDWIPPLLYFHYRFKQGEKLWEFIQKLEKKVLIEWADGFSYTERVISLNKILKLIDGRDSVEEVISELLFYKSDEKFHGKEPRSIDFKDRDRIAAILLNRLDDPRFYNLNAGRLARYILLRIDMSYWEKEGFPGYPGTITVEHILPQNPPRDSEWLESFDREEMEQRKNSLGNLVLLSGRKNSSAQNYEFSRKKEVYFKDRCTPFRITQSLQDYYKWGPEELSGRHKELRERALAIFLDY